jgi:hypothetical protein
MIVTIHIGVGNKMFDFLWRYQGRIARNNQYGLVAMRSCVYVLQLNLLGLQKCLPDILIQIGFLLDNMNAFRILAVNPTGV